MFFKSLLLCLCLFIASAQAEISLKVAKSNEEIPQFAQYLHRFEGTKLVTRTILPTIRLYAVFPTQNNVELECTPFALRYADHSCSEETRVLLQYGKCIHEVAFQPINDTCKITTATLRDEHSNSFKPPAKALKFPTIDGSPLVDKKLVTFIENGTGCIEPGYQDNNEYEQDTKRINVQIQTSRDNSEIELVMDNAYFGFPEETSNNVFFIVLCTSLAIVVILMLASVVAVKYSQLFFNIKKHKS
ncbi:hypothetical protein M3Y97_00632900 [Aphelenchoides bicaudatus]|nr:hypothetical protein M3Y97_00632900 [Aphelenchoides bicaudatus]